MSYIYIPKDPATFQVGVFVEGEFRVESEFGTSDAAAARVHYLNGGNAPEAPGHAHRIAVNLASCLNQVARATSVEPLPVPMVPGGSIDEMFRAIHVGIISLTDALRARSTITRLAKMEDGEPIFVLRAHDQLAPSTIEDWLLRALRAGVSHAKLVSAAQVATDMRAWQRAHGSKVPD